MEKTLIHVSRARALMVAAISAASFALLVWFAWVLADPDFSAGGARRAVFLEGIPVWLRAGFMGLCALVCLYAVIVSVKAAFRTDPSFSIGPDGVTDLRKTPPRRLGWDEIGEVTADANFLSVKRRGAPKLALGGNRISIPLKGITPGRDAILALFASR